MTASNTTIRDVASSARSLLTLDKDVLRILAITPWGPMHEATVCVDYDDFVRKFGGGYMVGYWSGLAVKEAFNGVRKIVVTRVCRLSSTTLKTFATAAKATYSALTGTTAPGHATLLGSIIGPFALAHGDTLIGNVNGVGNQTATISAVAASLQNGADENFAIVNLQDLLVKVYGGVEQTIPFLTAEFVAIGAATAEEVAAVINAKIVGAHADVTGAGKRITITSDRKGTGSYVEVTGGTANGVLSFNTTPVQGTGNVSNVNSVTVAELKTILEAAWTNGAGVTASDVGGACQAVSNTTGGASSIQCIATSTADTIVGFDNAVHTGTSGSAVATLKLEAKYHGVKGNTISYLIFAATSGVASEFDLHLYVGGVLAEMFQNLTMDSTAARYAESVLNTLPGYSDWIVSTDLDAVGTPTQRRPANTQVDPLAPTPVTLAGGNDGLASLAETDFIGYSASVTGLYAFDLLPQDGDLLICPDCTTTTFQKRAVTRCELDWMGKCIFVPDFDASQAQDYAQAYSHAISVDASEARTGWIWPWVKVANPDKSVFGVAETIAMPASALYCARMARNTQQYDEDVFKQPGNQLYGLLSNAVGVSNKDVLRKGIRDYLSDALINCIVEGKTQAGSFGVWVDDVQSGKKGGNWESVGEQRGVAYLRKVIEQYMETRRTQPNSEDTRWDDKYAIEGYLTGWAMRGVFASRDASLAFYVNTDPLGKGLNNPIEQRAKRYHALVALATAEPARFCDLMFTRDTRAVQSFIQQKMNT